MHDTSVVVRSAKDISSRRDVEVVQRTWLDVRCIDVDVAVPVRACVLMVQTHRV